MTASHLGQATAATTTSCAACGDKRGLSHRATEKMFGFEDAFLYFECGSCGCLQLVTPPSDLSRYYPDYYYSYAPLAAKSASPVAAARRWAAMCRNHAQLFETKSLWRVAAMLRPRQDVARLRSFFAPVARLKRNARILDVGSGAGAFLCELADVGFKNLVGLDPYLREDKNIGRFIHLKAASLDEVRGEFDIVMFNHSLEHMPDQVSALQTAGNLLHPDGVSIVAIPLAGSDPWSRYGTNWVELDAPRHCFLHTEKSLQHVAGRAGLDVYHCIRDTTEFAYWGSELYGRGLSLYDSESGCARRPDEMFGTDELRGFARRAAAANASARAGRATFYLRRRDRPPF